MSVIVAGAKATVVDVARDHGLSQVELASRLGVTEMAVSQWAHGKTRPRPELVLQFGTIVGMTSEEVEKLLEPYGSDVAYYHLESFRARIRVSPEEFANGIRLARHEALNGDANYGRTLASRAIEALKNFKPRPGVETTRTNELLVRAYDVSACAGNRGLQETDTLAAIAAMKARLAHWRSLELVPEYYVSLPLRLEAKLDYTMTPYELERQPNRAVARAQRGIQRITEYLERYGERSCGVEDRLRLLRELCLLYGVVKNTAGFRDESQRALRIARTQRAGALVPGGLLLTEDARVRGLLFIGDPSEILRAILQAHTTLNKLVTNPPSVRGAAASLAHTMLINAIWHWDFVCSKLGTKVADRHIRDGIRAARLHAHVCKLLHAAHLLQKKFGDGHPFATDLHDALTSLGQPIPLFKRTTLSEPT